MSNFEQLHPALQHHVVNSLGWRELRPFQDAVIPRILAGENLVILAPTAGGKTEAAFLPILSRMLSEDWQGLSVLYLCPIKALLNNLESRLTRYCSLVGRRAALWHGDVGAGARKRIQREPPDCVLTTPESLEVMLVSRNVDSRNLLGNVRAVIVDEIHAFAGDDRGWHLLSVLERVTHLVASDIQRIGLSATVGNPEALAGWLAGRSAAAKGVALPPPGEKLAAEVTFDYVGSLTNAAVFISRVGRGEKRLVFVDRRSRLAETVGQRITSTRDGHFRDAQLIKRRPAATGRGRLCQPRRLRDRGDERIGAGNRRRRSGQSNSNRCSDDSFSFLQRMGRTGPQRKFRQKLPLPRNG